MGTSVVNASDSELAAKGEQASLERGTAIVDNGNVKITYGRDETKS
jgi:hypothetical protein